METKDELDNVLEKHTFWEKVRISVMGEAVPSELSYQEIGACWWILDDCGNRETSQVVV